MDWNCSLSFLVQETGGVPLSQYERISKQTRVGAKDLAKTDVDPRSSYRLIGRLKVFMEEKFIMGYKSIEPHRVRRFLKWK